VIYSDGYWLADIDADPWVRWHVAKEASDLPYQDDGRDWSGDEDGPWRDLAEATAVMHAVHKLDARRIGEDIVGELDPGPSAEDRLARAMRRIQGGTYTEPAQLRPARDATAGTRG
jgi:hypothetical protein